DVEPFHSYACVKYEYLLLLHLTTSSPAIHLSCLNVRIVSKLHTLVYGSSRLRNPGLISPLF
ncbi:MAG: hypothetical protein QW544_05505, partial [Candidatus Caldarchaeum sp.]